MKTIIENIEQQIEEEVNIWKGVGDLMEKDRNGENLLLSSSYFTKEKIEEIIQGRTQSLTNLEKRKRINRTPVKIYFAETMHYQISNPGDDVYNIMHDIFPNLIMTCRTGTETIDECEIFAFHIWRHIGANRPWIIDSDVIDHLKEAASKNKKLMALCFDWQAAPYGSENSYRYIKEIDPTKISNKNFLMVE